MAGTRFAVAWTFSVQLGLLLAAALYWGLAVPSSPIHVEDDADADRRDPLLLIQWWRLWRQQQNGDENLASPRKLWETLSSYKKFDSSSVSSSLFPQMSVGWSASLMHDHLSPLERWLESLHKSDNLVIQRVDGSDEFLEQQESLFCGHGDVDESDATLEVSQALPDLWICRPRDESNYSNNNHSNPKRGTVRISPEGGFFVDHYFPSQEQSGVDESNNLVDLLNLLVPVESSPPPLPIETCLDTTVDFHFLIPPRPTSEDNPNNPSYFDPWSAWSQALEQSRRQRMYSWFPITTTPSSSTSSVTQQVQLLRSSDLQAQASPTKTAIDNQTTPMDYFLPLRQVKAFLEKQNPSSSTSISVYLLIPQHDNVRLVEDESSQSSEEPWKTQHNWTNLQITESADSLFIVLPLQHGNNNTQPFAAQRILQRVSQWVTQRCLGLTERVYTDVDWQPHPERRHRSLPTWFSKLFWQRALSQANSQAVRRAMDLVKRYKVWEEQEEQQKQQQSVDGDLMARLSSWMELQLHPQSTERTAQYAVQQIAAAHTLVTQQGRYASAVELLLQQARGRANGVESHQHNKDADDGPSRWPGNWNVLLLLDMSWDQYAAIVAPLLIPLILPCIITVVRETKQYLKLRFGKLSSISS